MIIFLMQENFDSMQFRKKIQMANCSRYNLPLLYQNTRSRVRKRFCYSFKSSVISLTVLCFSVILVVEFLLYDSRLANLKIDFSVVNCRNCSEIDFTLADNITGFPNAIVPNIVHIIHYGKPELSFVEMITIKSARANHIPDKIYIHCDCNFLSGKYWDMVKDISNLQVKFLQKPTHIFGRELNSVYHTSDIARMQVLMKYGGIYLDSDVYVVSSLDYYRKFECSIGWPMKAYLGTQVIIAHKDARFLKLWYQSYKYYIPERWYFNAGQLPTTHILDVMPNLVHRVARDFGVHDLMPMLYTARTDEWKTFKTIHLLIRHRHFLVKNDPIKEFDEENIKGYDKTFGDMCRLLIYTTSDLRPD